MQVQGNFNDKIFSYIEVRVKGCSETCSDSLEEKLRNMSSFRMYVAESNVNYELQD